MKRINCIIGDTEFLSFVDKNKLSEKERIFCRHDIQHFLDVSRLGWIINLEEKLNINKELIYAVGLLHDIGRWQEYEEGIDHAISSGKLAEGILTRCGFTEEEKTQIIRAIVNHRQKEHKDDLSRIMYRADKISRPCFSCPVRSQCKRFQNDEEPILIY